MGFSFFILVTVSHLYYNIHHGFKVFSQNLGKHDAYLEEMKMKFAKRMDRFGEGIFSRLAEIKNKRISEGKEVIDLSIGPHI